MLSASSGPPGLRSVLAASLPETQDKEQRLCVCGWGSGRGGNPLGVRSVWKTDLARTQLAWVPFISLFDKYLVSRYRGPGTFPGLVRC